MIKRLLLFTLLITTFPCFASVALVQGTSGFSSSGAESLATSSSVTSGNILVLFSKTQASTGTPTVAITNTGVACTWNVIATSALLGSTTSMSMQYCNIPSTGPITVTATWTGGSNNFTDLSLAEYSSSTRWVNPALDVSQSQSNNATICTSGITATTTVANELVVAVCGTFNAAQTWGTVGAYTNEASASRNTTGWYDTTVTSTGTQAFTTTIVSDISFGVIATFAQATGGTATPPGRRIVF